MFIISLWPLSFGKNVNLKKYVLFVFINTYVCMCIAYNHWHETLPIHLSANQAVVDALTFAIKQATTIKINTFINVLMRTSSTYARCCSQYVQPLKFNVIQ